MKKFKPLYLLFFVVIMAFVYNAKAQEKTYKFTDSWGKEGCNIEKQNSQNITINFSINQFSLLTNQIDGEAMQNISLSGCFLPNDAGYPDLPSNSKFIAIPQGCTPKLEIISYRVDSINDVNMAPAFEIPLEQYNTPLVFKKNMEVYAKNAYYPANPIIISEPSKIRGVDVITLGITPFQYNPVTKKLLVYRDIKVKISFEGGNGHFGDDAYRSRWFDPILEDALLNYSSLPTIDYNKRVLYSKDNEYEYLIVIPNNPEFQQWADSVKNFRTQQGIKTGIVKLADITNGNTVAGLKAYFTNIYTNWTIKPVAIMLMADYGSNAASTINSNLYTHPAGYPSFASDNYYADMTSDNLPDIIFSRMTANNATQLQVMCTKFLNYERNPPTDSAFYDHPITALGWQDDRWFQLGSEIVGGYLRSIGKHPVRINALGSPAVNTGNNVPGAGTWSTTTYGNTAALLTLFGPSGLNYIPAAPGTLGGFSGGTPTMVNNAINSGSFMLQHRDHGDYNGWGEPAYTSSSINATTNVGNRLPFVFSINCETGAFHNTSECFTEKFHRRTYNGQNSGALGLIAATEVSYSFVNDAFIWGMYDNMWPDFMPTFGAPAQHPNWQRGLLPAFACAAGKYFLAQSSWPYNTGDKLITYRLFHMHGDAFQTMYSEVPKTLTVIHDNCFIKGDTAFVINADTASLIALTYNGEILGTATGTGMPVSITVPDSLTNGNIIVTVTKQNYFRYSANVRIDSVVTTASYTYVQNLMTFYFTNTSENALSYDWDFGDGTTHSNEMNPTHTYGNYGTYHLTLQAIGSCKTDSISEEIGLYAGINNNTKVNNFFINPNPNSGLFYITSNLNSMELYDIEIVNTLNVPVYKNNNISIKGKLSVNLSDIPSGLYYLIIVNKNTGAKELKKFIKQ